MDLVLRWTCFYFKAEGLLVVDPERIRARFHDESSVAYEIFCALPWDLLAFFLGEGFCPLLRCMKLPQLLRLSRQLDDVERDAQRLFVYLLTPVRRLMNLNLALFLLCH